MKRSLVAAISLSASFAFGESPGWLLKETFASPDYADVLYKQPEDDSAYLRIALIKEKNAFMSLEERALSNIPGERTSQMHSTGTLEIRETRISAHQKALPDALVVSAVEKDETLDYRIGLQFFIKPHCPMCLKRFETMLQAFAHARISADAKSIKIGGESFDIGALAFATKKGYFAQLLDRYSSYLVGFGVTAGSVFFYILRCAKIAGGAVGLQGPCGNNMAVCQCGN